MKTNYKNDYNTFLRGFLWFNRVTGGNHTVTILTYTVLR